VQVKAPTRRQAHLYMSVTRVGFEPDLAGLKDQQPHQKSNEPFLVMYVRTSSAVVLM
jgi:hypothetical protein